jgi:chitodextrinase
MNTEHIIEQSNGPELTFNGQLLAQVSSRTKDTTRWTELIVYHTDTDKYIAVAIGATVFPHETTFVKATVCENKNAITRVFLYTNLAQRIYEELDFKPTQRI